MINAKTEFEGKKYHYRYEFIKSRQPNLGDQNEIFGVRLARYMNKYHLSTGRFVALCDEYRGAKGARVTEQDISRYLYGGCAPKIDKLVTIAKVMGVPISYFCGYGNKEPQTKNPVIAARFKKGRKSE